MVGDGEYGSTRPCARCAATTADRLGATVNYGTPDVNEDGPDVTAHSYDGLDNCSPTPTDGGLYAVPGLRTCR